MDTDDQEKMQKLFADAVYTSGISFNSITSKRWLDFFNKLRPMFKVPTFDQLSNQLLDESYNRLR